MAFGFNKININFSSLSRVFHRITSIFSDKFFHFIKLCFPDDFLFSPLVRLRIIPQEMKSAFKGFLQLEVSFMLIINAVCDRCRVAESGKLSPKLVNISASVSIFFSFSFNSVQSSLEK